MLVKIPFTRISVLLLLISGTSSASTDFSTLRSEYLATFEFLKNNPDDFSYIYFDGEKVNIGMKGASLKSQSLISSLSSTQLKSIEEIFRNRKEQGGHIAQLSINTSYTKFSFADLGRVGKLLESNKIRWGYSANNDCLLLFTYSSPENEINNAKIVLTRNNIPLDAICAIRGAKK